VGRPPGRGARASGDLVDRAEVALDKGDHLAQDAVLGAAEAAPVELSRGRLSREEADLGVDQGDLGFKKALFALDRGEVGLGGLVRQRVAVHGCPSGSMVIEPDLNRMQLGVVFMRGRYNVELYSGKRRYSTELAKIKIEADR
jgi:hypothetical protein